MAGMTHIEQHYAKFFDKVGWFYEHRPQGFKITPNFIVEFLCRHSECVPMHAIAVYIDEKAMNLKQAEAHLDRLEQAVGTSRYCTPNLAVFGADPSISVWEMPHGAGGGVETASNWCLDLHKNWLVTERA